jgi:predicted secreted Zn-dependent protease
VPVGDVRWEQDMVEVTLQIRTVSRETYVMRVPSFEGLRAAMNRRGEWGHFDPHVEFSFDTGGETVSAFTLIAAPEILLPTWAQRATADEPHGQAWDAMLAALTAHEENHFDIFNTWARNLRRSMQRQRPIPSSEFQARWTGFTDDLQTAQDRYDRTSERGVREGVRLDDPPSR